MEQKIVYRQTLSGKSIEYPKGNTHRLSLSDFEIYELYNALTGTYARMKSDDDETVNALWHTICKLSRFEKPYRKEFITPQMEANFTVWGKPIEDEELREMRAE